MADVREVRDRQLRPHRTVTVQRGSVLPAAQLLPGVAEVTVLARIWLPVSGLFTVTEKVIVADAPTRQVPGPGQDGAGEGGGAGGGGGVAVVGGVVQHPGQRVGERGAR